MGMVRLIISLEVIISFTVTAGGQVLVSILMQNFNLESLLISLLLYFNLNPSSQYLQGWKAESMYWFL